MTGAPRDTALVAAIEALGAEIVNLRAELRITHDGNIALRKAITDWTGQCKRAEEERDQLRTALQSRPNGDAWSEVQVYMLEHAIDSIGYVDGMWYAQIGNAEYSGATLQDAARAAADDLIYALEAVQP